MLHFQRDESANLSLLGYLKTHFVPTTSAFRLNENRNFEERRIAYAVILLNKLVCITRNSKQLFRSNSGTT